MTDLSFEVIGWLGCSLGDAKERSTCASLRILAGPQMVPVTEIYDSLGKTLREHINVPLYPLARWLVVNWWRLRWEAPRPVGSSSHQWLNAHRMTAISGDTPWPPLTFSGDGETVQLVAESETSADAAAIRYTQALNIDIPAEDFEVAVDGLLELVRARLSARQHADHELEELMLELEAERQNPKLSARCRLEALAGYDPGVASEEWVARAFKMQETAGHLAGDELLATVPLLPDGFRGVEGSVEAMAKAQAQINLESLPHLAMAPSPGTLPWQRGATLATRVRQYLGQESGPLASKDLEELVRAKLPLPAISTQNAKTLSGGYRDASEAGATSVLVPCRRPESQRFFVARLIAAALMSDAEQRVLPISKTMTAFQKAERSFAQELLCPWQSLREYVEENGTDDDSLADAAEYFQVSEYVIRNTLVNKGHVTRDHLPD